MSKMYDSAVTAQANGSRSSLTIAAIVGISPRIARKICRRLGLSLGNS